MRIILRDVHEKVETKLLQIYEKNRGFERSAVCNEPRRSGVYRAPCGAGTVLAGVAKLADARDLGSRIARCAGSSPVSGTTGRV